MSARRFISDFWCWGGIHGNFHHLGKKEASSVTKGDASFIGIEADSP
jgi:hypothetical protein